MKLNDDNKTVAAMDILVPKVGELIGGSEREYRMEVPNPDPNPDLTLTAWRGGLTTF